MREEMKKLLNKIVELDTAIYSLLRSSVSYCYGEGQDFDIWLSQRETDIKKYHNDIMDCMSLCYKDELPKKDVVENSAHEIFAFLENNVQQKATKSTASNEHDDFWSFYKECLSEANEKLKEYKAEWEDVNSTKTSCLIM